MGHDRLMFRKKDAVPPPKAPAPVVPLVMGKSGTGKSGMTKSPGTGAKPSSQSPAIGSTGKLAYEARRAEKAGMGFEKWMAEKDRRVKAEREAVQRARQKAPEKKPGLLRRLLDRAHRPI